MDKSFALAKYLFKIQRKNWGHMFFMFLVPWAFFYFNIIPYGVTESKIYVFVAIAPVQMLLFQFGNTFILYRQSGSLVKYQLLGFKPLEVMLGICISTFIFEGIYILGLFGIVGVATDYNMTFVTYANVLGVALVLNIFEFSMVLFITSYIKTYQQYYTYSMILFYSQLFILSYFGTRIPLFILPIIAILLLVIGIKKFNWQIA